MILRLRLLIASDPLDRHLRGRTILSEHFLCKGINKSTIHPKVTQWINNDNLLY